jgi:hypothetical protein
MVRQIPENTPRVEKATSGLTTANPKTRTTKSEKSARSETTTPIIPIIIDPTPDVSAYTFSYTDCLRTSNNDRENNFETKSLVIFEDTLLRILSVALESITDRIVRDTIAVTEKMPKSSTC